MPCFESILLPSPFGSILLPSPAIPFFQNLGPMAESPVLPFTPVTMTCKHMGYHVHKSGTHPREYERRYLLRDISLALRPGTITAIMGDTGAGKKLLLDVLAQQRAGRR